MAPRPNPASAPSAPSTVAVTAESSASMETANSAPAQAAAGVGAACAPGTSRVFAAVRFQTRTSKPAWTRLRAIGRPMEPRPRNATEDIGKDLMGGSAGAASGRAHILWLRGATARGGRNILKTAQTPQRGQGPPPG